MSVKPLIRNRLPQLAIRMMGVLFMAFAVACGRAERIANEAYRQYRTGAYETALERYARALTLVKRPSRHEAELRYNLGTTYYRTDQPRPAVAELLQAAERLTRSRRPQDRALRLAAVYNLGNALFRQEEYGPAAEAYREVLRLNATDKDAKHNLELALERQQEQSTLGGPASPDAPNPTPQPGQGEPEPLPQRPAGVSEEEAKRLLDMLGTEDLQRQRARVRQLLPPRTDTDKDW